jgi:hypothetical protein
VRVAVEGGAAYSPPALAGHYRIFAGDSVIDAFSVNPPAAESDLRRLDTSAVPAAVGAADLRVVRRADRWADALYRDRLGSEPWRWLMLAVLLALVVEMLYAAAGRSAAPAGRAAAALASEDTGTQTARDKAREPARS